MSVLLVNYNTAGLLPECLGKLKIALASLRSETIIVDNASRDESGTVLRGMRDGFEVIWNSINVGFGRANNQALPCAHGRYILLLNTDAFVDPDGILKTVAFMDAHPKSGVLGVRLVGSDGDLQPSCRFFPTPWNVFLLRTGLSRFFPRTRLIDDMAWDHASVRQCDWVPGCYYLVRREVIERVGLFDPRYFLYYEEVDHCRAVKAAGWDVTYFPDTTVIHLGGESAKADAALTTHGRQISVLQLESELLYFRKQHGAWGAWSALLLGWAADILLALRSLFRPSRKARIAASLGGLRLLTSVFVATRGGRRATR